MKSIRTSIAAGIALAAVAAVAATLTGSGKPLMQERQARGFTGLGLAIPATVEVTQGEGESLRITADDNVLPEIESLVEDGVLRLRWRDARTQVRNARIHVALQARTLESISIAGSGDVRAPALTSQRLTVDIAGSGDALVGGKVETLEVRISGSGDVKAAKMQARSASVSISGAGDATVSARDALRVRIAGSGAVAYYGDPKVQKSVAGSGSVRRLGAAPS